MHSTYSRKEISKCKKGSPLIIASSTKNHLEDLELCLELNPSEIYVEKGFNTIEEYETAKLLVKNIPTYVLSQYRYSSVFTMLKDYNKENKYNQIDYKWDIDKGEVSEWVYHIVSIDNFLKNKNNRIIVREPGTYRIGSDSDFIIQKSDTRNLSIYLETDSYHIKITLGKSNILYITEGDYVRKLEFHNEDCLIKQLREIFIFKNNKVLERL